MAFPYLFTALHFCRAVWRAYQCAQGWPGRYGYSPVMITNGTIIRFTTKHGTEKLLIQRSYHITQSTWKECSGKNCYEFWKCVTKTIRPCKRHLPNLWAVSWPLITFIPAVSVLDPLKCSVCWGRYSCYLNVWELLESKTSNSFVSKSVYQEGQNTGK